MHRNQRGIACQSWRHKAVQYVSRLSPAPLLWLLMLQKPTTDLHNSVAIAYSFNPTKCYCKNSRIKVTCQFETMSLGSTVSSCCMQLLSWTCIELQTGAE